MIAVPPAMIWPAWASAQWARWMDAWAAHLNPRYYVSQRDLDELAQRIAAWHQLLDRTDSPSGSDSSASSR